MLIYMDDSLFSETAKRVKASEIREILKLTQKPGIISLAGGLPNPQTFPLEEIKKITNDVLNSNNNGLQYGLTEGDPELRQYIAEMMCKYGIICTQDDILITHGSQQGLDLISKILINPGDVVLVEAPSYLGALSAFRSYLCNFVDIPSDDQGIRTDLLVETIETLREDGKKPKILYLVPNFHNPTGITTSEKRRKEIIRIANNYDLVVIEDNPYGELRYEGEHLKAIKSYDTDGRVIYLGTFSKILAPGFRIAWAVGNGELMKKMVIAKQAVDLHTNTFGQRIAAVYCHNYLEKHLVKILNFYKNKRDVMLSSLEEYMPKECKWTRPQGGMFNWIILPEYMDTKEMFTDAINSNVAYVIGSAFYIEESLGRNTMRLNFSFPKDEEINMGVKRLSEVIRRWI
ncbi:MAG: PLP-dependent aminotransferase family protein [Candidatus Methanofastidiosa archaeon]|nr:PLP-dependent aminotransferase family protein [Candidatus Methanofastidiosa archaeon]